MNQLNYNDKGSDKFPTSNSTFTSNIIILSKESSKSEIKAYFNAVLELQQSSDEFPVNLDSVWMLVYGRKEEATRALTSDPQFIEDIDYQVLRKTAENPKGGRPANEYKLSVSCMEFFIARKVRDVFEVYRQVFHKVTSGGLSRKELALMVVQAEEEKERLLAENTHQGETINLLTNEIKEAAPKVQYVNNVLQSVNTYTSTQMAKELGMREAEQLHKVLKEKGIMFKQSGQWMLTAKYSEKGYTKPRTTTYTRSDGSQGTNTITVWTELGRAFLHKVFTKEVQSA